MAIPSQPDVTQLLLEWSKGDRQSFDKLLPIVYQELRRLAQHYLQQERPDHTLQATALVHEAYLKLIDTKIVRWENRAHFFAVTAQVMRHILVDLARQRRAQKRGGGQKLALDEALGVPDEAETVNLVALDEALDRLAAVDARQSRIIELRYFGGLSMEETAEVLGISTSTVKREWRMARAWLHREIRRD
jgi:RNA polymerase sigma factor (TIGR02999 family)